MTIIVSPPTTTASTDAIRGRWAISVLFFANGLTIGAWAPQIPLLLPRHQIAETTLGMLIFFLGLGAVAAMLTTGRLLARFGSRNTVRAFAFALAPTLPLIVMAPTLPVLAVTMVLLGGFLGSMDVAMNANAVEVEIGLDRAAMSSFHGFWSLGGFVGAGAGGWIVAQYGAAAGAWVACGMFLILMLAAQPFVMATPLHVADPGTPRDALIPRDAGLWVLGMISLFCMVPEGAVMDWAAIYLQKELGATAAASTLAFAFFSGAMAIVRFGGDAVRNRFGAVRTLRGSAMIGTAGLAVAAFAPGPALAIAGFAFAGIGVANMIPIIFSAAGNYPGLAPGTAIAFVTMMGYSGILFAPSSIGFVAEHFGFTLTFAALAVLLGVVAILARRAWMAERQIKPAT